MMAQVLLKVLDCESFKSRKDGKLWTTLLVKVKGGHVEVFAEGDQTHLLGKEKVPFVLGLRKTDKGSFLNLYYNEEDVDNA